MPHNPRTVAALAMQRLNDSGQVPTPENFARLYYEISVKPLPGLKPDLANLLQTAPCQEFVRSLKEVVEETVGITDHLAADLGQRNRALEASAERLKQGSTQADFMYLVAAMLAEAAGILQAVESTRRELERARQDLQQMQEKLAEAHRQLGEDPLTGTLNRRGLDEALNREVARAHRNQGKLSVVMIDLDHFKAINDTHGHEAGDRMIVHFAEIIRSLLRRSDALARYGGEEFVIVLADTDLSGARKFVQRLQGRFAKTPLAYDSSLIGTTFSAGIAELRPGETGLDVLRRADVGLYAAKAAGRNCIRVVP